MEKTVILQLKNITKKFGTKVIANNNVSLDVYKGEILSILGENGCGKTTLMNMVAGIYYPDSGKILINGELDPPSPYCNCFNIKGSISDRYENN